MQTETRWLVFSAMTFITGLVLGLSTGVLYAPQKGIRTRQNLKNFAEDAAEQVGDWAEGTKQTIDDMVKRGRKTVQRR